MAESTDVRARRHSKRPSRRPIQVALGIAVGGSLVSTPSLAGQGARHTAPSVAPDASRAVRLDASATVTPDGILAETVWSVAEPLAGFRQREPDEGAPATERTDVRIVYDTENLYVGIVAHDRSPHQVIHRIRQRDRLMELDGNGGLRFAGDDAIAVLIDPFHDHRNAIVLATNANGAEFDAQIADEGRQINVNWRGLWTVAAARHEGGWSAEFVIPFRTLRAAGSEEGRTIGFNVYRVIQRRNEHVLWRAWRRGSEDFLRVSRAGDVEGFAATQTGGVGIDVKPYALTGAGGDGDPTHGQDAPYADAGLDLKYEVRPGLVLDATVNADFAQVEVDDEQVNLTRFDLFLPEKRDFFLENSGMFEFGIRGNGEPPPFLLFFSRRIGIADTGAVPLRGGLRLSGRAGRQTVGVLHAVTGQQEGHAHQQHTVARVTRDIGASGYIGGMVTRTGPADTVNLAGGIDWSLWPTSTLNLQGFAVRTRTDGAGDASLAYRLGTTYHTEHVRFTGQHLVIEPDVRADLGFVTRTDIRRTDGLLQLAARPAWLGLREVGLHVVGRYITRVGGEFQDWETGPAVPFTWNSGDNVTPYYTTGHTQLDDPFAVGGRVPVASGRYRTASLGLMASTSPARRVRGTVHLVRQRQYGGRIVTAAVTGDVAPLAGAVVGLEYTFNRADLPNGSLQADVMSLRVAYAFTTRLSTSLRAQYNGLDRRIFTSARLAYQYRPGSDILVAIEDVREQMQAALPDRRSAIVKVTWLSRW